MMIGSLLLDNDLMWEDEFKFTRAAGTAEHTIYGNLVVQTFPITGYRPLTLTSSQNNGWQKRDTVINLQVLADADPATVYTVTMPDTRTFQAMFRYDEAPVVEFSPIALATAPEHDFWYYGTVKMRIIE